MSRAGLALEATGELPAIRAEVAGIVERGVLLADDDPADTARACDEITRRLLEGALRRKEVGHEHGSTGSLFHNPKAIGKRN